MLFPRAREGVTGVELRDSGDGLPAIWWTGVVPEDRFGDVGTSGGGPGTPMLGEHAHGRFTRPHLRGHRVDSRGAVTRTGRSWSTRFTTRSLTQEAVADDPVARDRLRLDAEDAAAELVLVAEVESVAGGALRVRYALTNTGPGGYVLEGLEVVLPVAEHLTEVLDFTGRHERERTPQRHVLTDGLWMRESRGGRPGLAAATMLVVGTPGFDTDRGEVLGVHVAWSGNSVLRVERDAASAATLGGGELLQPGEMTLSPGATYTTPWVFFAASEEGLDGLAAVFHDYQRALPSHPDHQPVMLNVWEAVYFDHDLPRLKAIAERAARVGVERFVLDDGWFRNRRDDTAGLGDWWVDESVWPEGLDPIIEHVHRLGMEFGLWFEPEMVNPDSDLYREHPDWIMSSGARTPLLHRNQLVLDLSRSDVWEFLYERVHALLGAHRIAFVKWDHNRELLEAGSGRSGGAPAVHEQTQGFYRLLDALAAAHPEVTWESCASGGGRVDLGVAQRVQRFWTSDMTDAVARQQIQRWTGQLLAPEYIGAHISSPTSHTTGRTLPLDFRAATALFGAFGIEWDLVEADDDELARIAEWVSRFKAFRPLLHSGRVVRPASSDPAVLLHGVVATDRIEALVAHVQMDESSHNRGVSVRVPGLDPAASYRLAWEGPVREQEVSMSAPLHAHGPLGSDHATGSLLARRGFWMPRRRPETVTLVHLTRV